MSNALGTVARAAEILVALSESEGDVAISDVVERLSLPPSTVHRLLALLAERGFVAPGTVPHRYAIGPELYRVSALVLQRMSPIELSRDFLKRVVEESGETCFFGLGHPSSGTMSFEAVEYGPHPLQYRIELHRPFPLVWGASGLAILAFLPDDEIRSIAAASPRSPATGVSVPGVEKLLRGVVNIRARGYAISYGEKLPDAVGIASPVFDGAGRPVGDLCITLPRSRHSRSNEPRFAEILRTEATELSRALGHRDRRQFAAAAGSRRAS